MATAAKIGIGSAINRVDGIEKVTGTARYAAEHPVENLLYGYIVEAAIAKGRITDIDEETARAVPGVMEVITHLNRPHVAWTDRSYRDEMKIPGSPFRPLYDDRIQFNQQPIALVVAETFESARYAASLVEVAYEAETHNTDFEVALGEKYVPKRKRSTYMPPKARGDAARAFEDAPLKVAGDYRLAPEHHNPMEMFGSTVEWHDDDSITVWDKTQGSQGVQAYLASVFGFSKKKVRVLNPYVGGAFGSGLRPQHQVFLAVLAAKMLERSVRVTMTRQQMFSHAYRPQAIQSTSLGAETTGKLTSIRNDATTSTSRYEDNMENVVTWGLMNYDSPNADAEYTVAQVDTATSADMRAPGAATGMTLFEIAIDEMAYVAKVDPLEFRLINYSPIDAMNGTPYTSKALREAFHEGAEAFGWNERSVEPRSMRDGKELVGWGCATGMWDAQFAATSASAKLTANGHLEVACATSDIGTGSYTVMTLVAADTLGLLPEQITARLGDSDLPTAPVEGGSWGAASSGAAVQLACQAVGKRLLKAAGKINGRPLGDVGMDDVLFEDGCIVLKDTPTVRVPFGDAMRAADLTAIEEEATAAPGFGDMWKGLHKSKNTHSAIFAEVRVDEELGVVRVTRIVDAVAAGRIINPKTARSQILGGVVMGIGMALHEETFPDHRLGRWMNHNFGEYHVPVHADVHDIQVIFVDEPDPEVTSLGVKGLGEIGIVGTAAAIANAIYHATGKRVRSLPITIDKILE